MRTLACHLVVPLMRMLVLVNGIFIRIISGYDGYDLTRLILSGVWGIP